MMMAAASSFDTNSLRPSPEDIAYHPTPDALNFRYHGESQAEFEARERRCLSIAIYYEARGEPVRGQVAVGAVDGVEQLIRAMGGLSGILQLW